MRSPLRHLDPETVGQAAKRETRNREVHLPPVSTYRWWARRTEAVNGAVIDAVRQERNDQLLISDPFAGGGVIPLAAVLRGQRVYAQDLNPWAVYGLTAMLALPEPTAIREASQRLFKLIEPTLVAAYATELADGTPAMIAHTFRVAAARCSSCGVHGRLFPHAMLSLRARKERRRAEAFLACPAGHVFAGRSDQVTECPDCARTVDPGAVYTRRRVVICSACAHADRLEDRAKAGSWSWEVVLVERVSDRRRELALPSAAEVALSDEAKWEPLRALGDIPEGQETRVLRRHGFQRWEQLYTSRQRVVLERLLSLAPEATCDERVNRALELAIVGAAEMAGHLSRWDRWYLKSYESMAGHRFNFTTFAAEPNVWGTLASGRGTVRRRLESFAKASGWLHERVGRDLAVERPGLDETRSELAEGVDVRAVEDSSERIRLPDASVDLTLTDPPYHDDVQYDELSLPLRAWAGLSREELVGEAVVNPSRASYSPDDHYRSLLTVVFGEIRRTLRPEGHLIFSYANRRPEAWGALFGALHDAGLRAVGFQLCHSENETDYAKRAVRACTLDLLMDLVPVSDAQVEQWHPETLPLGAEGTYLGRVAKTFMRVGDLEENWQVAFLRELRATKFLSV